MVLIFVLCRDFFHSIVECVDMLAFLENKPKETLLHFAAQYGLKDFINVLLNLPGANQALSTCNISGLLPRDVARESGRIELVEILDAERLV